MVGDSISEEHLSSGPHLGEVIAEFEAITTHGPFKLSHFRDYWVILFSYPSDFTPVVATEFIEFAQTYAEFEQRNCRLVGLSCDSLSSHIAWVRDLEAVSGIRIPFPVIADPSMRLAKAFGMIHPATSETSPTSSTFVLDHQCILRAMMFYAPSTGRSVRELLRLVAALQIADVESVDTPADWQPGEPALIPAPRTQESADRRLEEDPQCKAWYLCRRPL